MKARRPRLDFERSDPLWIPAQPGFAHALNGGSSVLPYLEPYLIKVQKLARDRLVESHPALAREIGVFNQQEANHYRVHALFNRVLRERYPGVEPFEREIERDFERMLSERSLRFNLAYCEGFESTGLIQAELYLEHLDDVLEGADPAVRDLWRWHLAEEFEHRSVCHDALRALHPGWLYRVGMYLYVLWHLNGHGRRVRRHLIAVDRARGRIPRDLRSRLRALRFSLRTLGFMLPRMLAVLSPFYDPRRRATSLAVERALAAYEGAVAS